jgi:prepilin signal peptidase PulO-like enzyme (type II secretory pathway)
VILVLFLAFLFGSAIGSFLNVVVYRLNTGMSMVNDRSVCFSCGKQLYWYELIPIFSFLWQGGKCTKCKARISWQYMIVEACTGIIFAGIVYILPPIGISDGYITAFSFPIVFMDILLAAIWSILIVIFVYDLRHKIIPDELAFWFGALSFAHMFISVTFGSVVITIPSVLDILAGPILFLPFYLLWKVSGGKWMGLGDAKLAIGIGWFLGLSQGISALIMAFWIGALVGVALIILKQLLKRSVFHRIALYLSLGERIMKSEIPFAPFLIIGIAIAFFFRVDALHLAVFAGTL